MKVGIFGGTFNPPHKTHISLALEAKRQLQLDKLVVVPCGLPPHKHCEVDKETRLALTRLAFGDFAQVDDCEIVKEGKSYTVETLRLMRQKFPSAELFLIIGGDSFRDFGKWYCPQEIASMATLAVAARSHKTFASTVKKNARLGVRAVMLDVQPNDVSSTEIRLRYQFGLDNSAFVSPQVDEFVQQNNLYAQYRPMVQKLRGYLSQKRFDHTFYVVKRGLEFANDANRDKVFVACLLHDCAKYIPPERYAEYGFTCPQDMPEPIVHAFLGSSVARKDFGVEDSEILDAITFHSTGCPNMTELQKIVYVADKTEESRPYPLSHLLKGSLHQIFLKCLQEANSYTVAQHGRDVYPLTEQTLQYYLQNKK